MTTKTTDPLCAGTLRKPIAVRDGLDYNDTTTSPVGDILVEATSGRPDTGPLEELSQWFDERRAEAHPRGPRSRGLTRAKRARTELRAMSTRLDACALTAKVVRYAQEGRTPHLCEDERRQAAALIGMLAQALGGAL